MFCEQCGSTLPSGAAFCHSCGSSIPLVSSENRQIHQAPRAHKSSNPSLAKGQPPVHFSRFVYIGAAVVAAISLWLMNWRELGIFTENGMHSLWGWIAFLAALTLGGVATYDAANRRNRKLNVWAIMTGAILVASFVLEIAYLATLCDKNDLFCIRPGMGDGPFLALLDGICLIVLPFFIDKKRMFDTLPSM